MGFRQQILAIALATQSVPALAGSAVGVSAKVPTVVRVPLDARSPKERDPIFVLAMQGKREYESINLDTQMLNFIGGGIEAKFLIAGAIAIDAAMAAGGGGKGTEQRLQEQQNQQVALQQKKQAQGSETGSQSSGGSGSNGGVQGTAPCPQTCPK